MMQMKKVYMVGIASPEPNYRLQMDEVYCFQASTKTLSRCEVRTIGKPKDPVLRIRWACRAQMLGLSGAGPAVVRRVAGGGWRCAAAHSAMCASCDSATHASQIVVLLSSYR
jgi:hypothetical protein